MNNQKSLIIDASGFEEAEDAKLYELLEKVACCILKKFSADGRFVNLLLLGRKDILLLNEEFRGKSKTTDVLSWEYDDELIPEELVSQFPWGEMAICVPVAKEQALKNGWGLEIEMVRLLVHGLVHLAGYDHELSNDAEIEMLALEKQLLKDCAGLKDIYP